MRAREPDADGFVHLDGVKLHWEVFGDGQPTLLLLPTWTVIHSRFWKAQVPYLARHFRVVTYDGPGNGRSDRPEDPGPYGYEAEGRAAAAVLDATGTGRAVVVSLSMASQWALWLTGNRPDRVLGNVFIGPTLELGQDWETPGTPSTSRTPPPRAGPSTTATTGWTTTRTSSSSSSPSASPSRTRPSSVEDAVGWGLETSPEVLLAEVAAPAPDEATLRAWCGRARVPTLVIHGDKDRISPLHGGELLAEATGGALVILGGAGHIPMARDPVKVNLLIREFAESLAGAEPAVTAVQAPSRPRTRRGEQTRARYPDAEGYAERDGVRLFWERYGDGEPTVLLLPTWSIVHSRHWKAQIPYLARHFRVLTFDGRGNGRSDRPAGRRRLHRAGVRRRRPGRHGRHRDRRAVVAGVSCGALWATMLAADHPDRVAGLVTIGPAVGLAPPHPERAVHSFLEPLDTDEGWARYNLHYWLRDYPGFLEFFFSKCLTEPHSTKQREDCVGWGLEIAPETLADAQQGLLLCGLESFRDGSAAASAARRW